MNPLRSSSQQDLYHSVDRYLPQPLNQYSQSTDDDFTPKGITEIVLPAAPGNEYQFIFPMLAHLSQQCKNRWFTWIAPRGINKQLLLAYGFALDKLRIIYTRNSDESSRVLYQALSIGNSQTVVVSYEGFVGREGESELARLEQAASIGCTQGLLLRHRSSSW